MDSFLIAADKTLRTLFARSTSRRPMPRGDTCELNDTQRRHSIGLMRVNHVGEVCAQALYTGQILTTKNESLRKQLQKAGDEELDHLAWTKERLDALGGQTSALNPLWYAGALCMGMLAGKISDKVSMGFIVETEKQVGAHLDTHLDFEHDGLPKNDSESRAIVAHMKADELRHAQDAQDSGAVELPVPIKKAMKLVSKVMTTVAYRI